MGGGGAFSLFSMCSGDPVLRKTPNSRRTLIQAAPGLLDLLQTHFQYIRLRNIKNLRHGSLQMNVINVTLSEKSWIKK